MKLLNSITVDGIEFEVEEYFDILETLRESGKINMFGAPRWLENQFGLTKNQAQFVFMKWTETYK